MNIPKIPSWKGLVDKIQQGQGIGIHGLKYCNLNPIKITIEQFGGFSGHYFGIGEQERELPSNEIYPRLFCTVTEASKHNNACKVESGTLEILTPACIILGIFEDIRFVDTSSTPFNNEYGQTFGVGHDMGFGGEKIDFYPLIIKVRQLEHIREKVTKMSWNTQNNPYRDLCMAKYVQREITASFLRKMYHVLRFSR